MLALMIGMLNGIPRENFDFVLASFLDFTSEYLGTRRTSSKVRPNLGPEVEPFT
jgi:hypothetical protein